MACVGDDTFTATPRLTGWWRVGDGTILTALSPIISETLAIMRESPPLPELCDELAAMAQMDFNYQDQVAPNRYVSRLGQLSMVRMWWGS